MPLLLFGHDDWVDEAPFTPTLLTEFAFGKTWQDELDDDDWGGLVESTLSTTRGRSNELTQFSAGTADNEVQSNGRELDPLYAAGPYYGKLLPNVPMRVRMVHEDVSYPIWRGFTDGFTLRASAKAAVSDVPCTDAFKILAGVPLSLSVYDIEVLADAPTGYWRLGETERKAPDQSGNKRDGEFSVDQLDQGSQSIIPFNGPSMKFRDSLGVMFGQCIMPASARITTKPFSIEIWVKADLNLVTTGNHTVIYQAEDSTGNAHFLWVVYAGSTPGITLNFWVGTGTPSMRDVHVWDGDGAIADGNTHHVVYTVDASDNARLYIDGVDLGAGATSSTISIPTNFPITELRVGRVTNLSWPGWTSHFATYDSVLTAARVATHYEAALHPWEGDFTDERIERILDLIGWPANLRALDSGEQRLGPASLAGQDALSYLQSIAASEGGRFFIDNQGRATFHSALRLIDSTVAYTFAASTLLNPSEIAVSIDDTFVYDGAEFSREGGAPQRALAPGVTSPQRLLSIAGLLNRDDRDVRAMAERYAYRYSTPQPRITSWAVAPEKQPSEWSDLLSIEIGDLVAVQFTPAGVGDEVELQVVIESIKFTAKAGAIVMVFTGSPVDPNIDNYFTFDGDGATQGFGTGVFR